MIGALPILGRHIPASLREYSGEAERQLAEVTRALARADLLRPEHWAGDALTSIQNCTAAMVPSMRFFQPVLHFGVGKKPFDHEMREECREDNDIGAIALGRSQDMEVEVVTLDKTLALRHDLISTALQVLEGCHGLDVFGPNRTRDDVTEGVWGGWGDENEAVANDHIDEESVISRAELDAQIPPTLYKSHLKTEALAKIAREGDAREAALARELAAFPHPKKKDALYLELEEVEPARVLVTLSTGDLIGRFYDDHANAVFQGGNCTFGWGRWFSLSALAAEMRAVQQILAMTAAKDRILCVLQAIEDGSI